MTFDETSIEADQVFELHQDRNGTIEYATKWAFYAHLN